MDVETADLIAYLCTRVGVIMEDVSPLALADSKMDKRERTEMLSQLSDAVRQMERLISAAAALNG